MRGEKITARRRDEIVAALADPTNSYEALSQRFGLYPGTLASIARANGFTRVGRSHYRTRGEARP